MSAPSASSASKTVSLPVPSANTMAGRGSSSTGRGSSSTGTTPTTTKPISLSTPKLRRTRPLSTYNFSPPARLPSSSPPPSSPIPTTSPSHLSAIYRPYTPDKDWDLMGLDTLSSSFRARSRSRENSIPRSKSKSPGGGGVISGVWKKDLGQNPPEDAAPTWTSWWNHPHMGDLVPRPWKDPPKRQKTVPAEQTEAWAHTRDRVAQAVASVLGTAAEVAHEALFTGVDLLQLAPIPGLAAAGKALLNIWDAVQLVDMNRLQCLRLTERCAEILLSIRQEVHDAGDEVGQELAVPYQTLLEAYDSVRDLILKQANWPWITRYLKRNEIQRMITQSDAELTAALSRFGLSIQIRILRTVQDNEARRQEDADKLIDTLIHTGALSPDYVSPPPLYGTIGGGGDNALQLSGVEKKEGAKLDELPPLSLQRFPSSSAGKKSSSAPTQFPSPSGLRPAEVLSHLCALHNMQNSRDAARDVADLRNLMRAAMQTQSGEEFSAVLRVAKEEMPEALKTLQRALEQIVENEGSEGSVEKGKSGEEVTMGNGKDEAEKGTKTASAEDGQGSGSWEGSGSDGWSKDTLDREFIESGIDALRRMSGGVDTTSLPSWTITRYEVDRERLIGVGFFSDVYRGTWRGSTVAIKVLAETTPRDLFKREVAIWASLHHPHVLKLCGASSAAGEPPWFFVAPYQKHGSLVQYLKGVETRWKGGIGAGGGDGRPSRGMGSLSVPPSPGRGRTATISMNPRRGSAGAGDSGQVPREWDLYRFMHEIAKGMEYLHANGVLHGDLKAANVLVDDNLRCVISDFGQSEMKSEACRISGKQPPHGTLRWQSPELMAGLNQLTPESDVYAYAISCVEILSMGRLPWPLMDDDAVRHFVLKDNTRPAMPDSRFNTPALQELLQVYWHSDPAMRPSFRKIVLDVRLLRKSFGSVEEVVKYSPGPTLFEETEHVSKSSPDLKPIPMPIIIPVRDSALGTPPPSSAPTTDTTPPSFHTAFDNFDTSPSIPTVPHREDTVSSQIQDAEQVLYMPNSPNPTFETFDTLSPSDAFRLTVPSSRTSSLFTHAPNVPFEENPDEIAPEYDGYTPPSPEDEPFAEKKNEQRYRILLTHQFHRSLTLPLWSPTPVDLGAVGYLSKPSGTFVTLFNVFQPDQSDNAVVQGMPSIYGYGRVGIGSQRKDERNAAQRSIDAFVGKLAFRNRSGLNISQSVTRRYSFPLRSGHKTSYMCTETTVYDYMDNLHAPKKWFKANIGTILQTFGAQHRIQKEDLFLVIGTLKAPNYALFVSHHHPDGQAHFNVFSSQRDGQPWGTFTTDTEIPHGLAGPSYDETDPATAISASKVSNCGGPWDTVLIARLRFKPDVLEPTSLL